MKQLKFLGYAFALAVSIISCNRDDESISTIIPENGYRNGILVANEGNFGRPNANISYISAGLSKIDNDLYTNINGENIGDVFQSVGFYGNNAYFVINNSNKVIVADRYTFAKKAEITQGIKSPRYITFADKYIFVTNNTFDESGFKSVSVYNISDNSFVKSIPIKNTAERIVALGNYIFVQNASFNEGKMISQFSIQSNEVEYPIPFEENISKILGYKNTLYVLAGNEINSYIYRLDDEGEDLDPIELIGIPNARNLEISNDTIYFTSGTGAYSMPLSGTTPKLLFNVQDNKFSTFYGFNVIDNYIYTSDAKGFTQGSEVNIYTLSGQLVKTFTAGIGVNGFYKN